MRYISPPLINYRENYRSIYKDKSLGNKRTLINIERRIFAAYDGYKARKLKELKPLLFTTIQKEALLGCYKSRTKVLVELRDVILKKAGNICPYCGHRLVEQVDHFVPETRFPEFSVLPLNLIGICGPCNLTKDERLKENGIRVFLHSYFDKFPQDCFCLKAKTIWDHNVISFEYEIDESYPNISKKLLKTLKSHVTELNILNDYAKLATKPLCTGSAEV